MKFLRINRLAAWFENFAMGVSEILRAPEPIPVPVRTEIVTERDLIERRKLLERSRPRLPP